MRSRSEPDQVAQAGFGFEWIAVTQRVIGCYCGSARTDDPGGLREKVSQMKDAERRDNKSVRTGKDTRSRQDPWKPSKRRRCKKRTAGLGTKSNLRVKRRDPWHRANVPTKSEADPALSGEDAEKNSQPCLDLVCKPVAQPPAQASWKASLEIQSSQDAGRPCYEAEDSACRGE